MVVNAARFVACSGLVRPRSACQPPVVKSQGRSVLSVLLCYQCCWNGHIHVSTSDVGPMEVNVDVTFSQYPQLVVALNL